jgi:hypothetical protein
MPRKSSATVLERRAKPAKPPKAPKPVRVRPKRIPRIPGTNKALPGAGRPTRYTHEIGHEIARGVETIGFLAVAAESVGVHRQTAYNWQRWGLGGDELYAPFADMLLVARGRWMSRQVARVEDPRWLLERADPSQFGPKVEAPVQVNVVTAPLTREAALARLSALAEDDQEIAAALQKHRELTA